MESFRDNAKRAHVSMQAFLELFGKLAAWSRAGDCRRFFSDRTTWISLAAYPNVPADLQDVYNIYRNAVDAAVNAADPIFKVCSAGGGTIEQATIQYIFSVVDASQNQIYQVRKQIEGIP